MNIYYFGFIRSRVLLAVIVVTVGDLIFAADIPSASKAKFDEADELNAKKLAIHALASQLVKGSTQTIGQAQRSRSVTTDDIEQAGLGTGVSQKLSKNDPRNAGSRFGWLFGSAETQKSAPSSLAAHPAVHSKPVASLALQNSTDELPDDDDIDERAAAADALKVSKDKEVWFIVGLGIFIVAVIVAALVGIKYARTCLVGDKGAAPKPQKVAPRQASGYGATPAYPPG